MPTSNAESVSTSTTTDQFKAEALDRLTEAIPPSLGLSRYVGLDNMQKMLAGARRRTSDSHRAQMEKLKQVQGIEFPLTESTEDEEVAINVQGDTTYNQPAAQQSSLLTTGAAALAAAALPLAGIGVYEMITDDQPAAVVQPAEQPPQQPPTGSDRDSYVPYAFGIE